MLAGAAARLAFAAPAASVTFRKPPLYETARSLIDPSPDQFECEKFAASVERASEALRARFTGEGEIVRARFHALAANDIRFELHTKKPAGIGYVSGRARVRITGDSLQDFTIIERHTAEAAKPLFADVTGSLFGADPTFANQLSRGVPYWRARLDVASGIDIYGNNGIAVGDADGDGWDEIYVCQPGGLPNRLFRRGPDGSFEDISAAAGLDILDDTPSALFLDLRNSGRQDLVVLTSGGPLLFLNRTESGRILFEHRPGAFRFTAAPQGAFTGMAAADYDRDGKLDLYLCTYIYFQSEDQYKYPSPYHDARNGPPNFLFHNRLDGDGTGHFEDVSAPSGLGENNNRYSFAPAWCDINGDGWPDLYVANDFGRNNLYRNDGGKFRDVAVEAGVEDLGPGMSAAWFDSTGNGQPDLYVANMWSAAGQRIAADPKFSPVTKHGLASAYQRHTKGNSLFLNRGEGKFYEAPGAAGAAMGRWAWSADAADFDCDGAPEIVVTCGMLTGNKGPDLMSYFWRQVVDHSPAAFAASDRYEQGWNNINQWIREGYPWNGNEPNVFYVGRGDSYVDHSGVSGLDFIGDSRAFALTDLDGDGRPDLVVKNRLGPQIRAFQNQCAGDRRSIAIELQGVKSNRDAIGARVEVHFAKRRSVQWLSAGSGYLSQHSKRLHFGLGSADRADRVIVVWPSGIRQRFSNLQAGHVYRFIEGEPEFARRTFLPVSPNVASPVKGDNDPKTSEAWLLEPVAWPLPIAASIPRLITVAEPSAEIALLRRYLFDYRADLETPCSFLVDEANRVHKFYQGVPDGAVVERDLKKLRDPARLPFAGRYYSRHGRTLYRLAAAFLAAGYFDPALIYLAEHLRQSPDDPKALLAVGQIYLEKSDLRQSRDYLERSARIDPASAELHNNLGGIAMAEERYADAAAHFEQALKLRPGAAYALGNAGQAYARLGQNDRAESSFRAALAADPADADSANRLGLLLARAGKRDEARAFFQHAITHRRDHAGAINNLGVLYMQAGQRNDALAALLYGVEAAPDDETIVLNLARLYVSGGEREKAALALERFLDRNPKSQSVQRALKELAQ